MDESRLLLSLRTITFCCVDFICFIWIIMYSVVIFLQWEAMDQSERALISIMLIVNVITLLTLLILLLLEFRVWLDVARVCLLLIAQIGTAGAFVHWRPLFHCDEKAGDEQGICNIVSLYVLISSWIPPILLFIYLAGLAVRAYRHYLAADSTADNSGLVVVEAPAGIRHLNSTRPSLLPIAGDSQTPMSLHFLQEAHHKPTQPVNTRPGSVSVSSKYSSPPTTPSTNVNSRRLSKRSPLVDYV